MNRTRRGRPPISPHGNRKISFRLPMPEVRKVQRLAKRRGVRISDALRDVAAAGLKALDSEPKQESKT